MPIGSWLDICTFDRGAARSFSIADSSIFILFIAAELHIINHKQHTSDTHTTNIITVIQHNFYRGNFAIKLIKQ